MDLTGEVGDHLRELGIGLQLQLVGDEVVIDGEAYVQVPSQS